MTFRTFDITRDADAVHRIWREVGWMPTDTPAWRHAQEGLIADGTTLVADVHGQAECMVLGHPGSLRYLKEALPLQGIMAVCAGFVARRQGIAGKLTAALIAQAAQEGALVSGLGMFDQGYYNKLGFGSGPYKFTVRFDPAQLRIPLRARPPHRLGPEHADTMHASRLACACGHGGVDFPSQWVTRRDSVLAHTFGLGYFDGPNGEISHYMWCMMKGEHGPLRVIWMAHQTREQFLELMAVLRDLGDQVRLVSIREPRDIQIQDLMDWPLKQRTITHGGSFEAGSDAGAYWQMRMLDVPGCLAKTHLPGGPLRFNLALSDPIERYLDADSSWKGVAGDYVITLGLESAAERGTDKLLPTLTATVNAFTRLWLGVRPATGLAVTDDLAGPQELLEALDETLRLPTPVTGWDF